MIWEQYLEIEAKMKEALAAAGRPIDSARLLAVSKTHPLEAVEELAAHGVKAFGENKVQELCAKQETTNYDLEWHLIGHLQRNKVRQLLKPKVAIPMHYRTDKTGFDEISHIDDFCKLWNQVEINDGTFSLTKETTKQIVVLK